MTGLLMIIGVTLLASAGVLLVRVLILPRLRLQAHLRDVDSYGFTRAREEPDTAAARGALNGIVNARARELGQLIIARLPHLSPLRRGELTAAGYYDMTVETMQGFRALAATVFPALVVLYAIGSGGLSAVALLAAIGAAAAGWQLPALAIRRQGRRRLDRVDRDLPQLIDLLVATVEAGSAFASALDSVARRFRGPLGEELQLVMRHQALGISTERALGDMLERCETPSTRAFVRTVIRAQSHGASIGPVLRHLAGDIRKRRHEEAREKVQKAPVKMLFPLMFLIMPSLMLVILYPAMYSIVKTLSHG